jgi:predicted enzyme involved in methoxymalonyl-ACP biosynthesis
MVLREMLDHAKRWNMRRIVGIFRPTDRNKLVEEHYQKLGFTLRERKDDNSVVYDLDLSAPPAVATAPMTVRSSGFEAPQFTGVTEG